MCTGFRSVDVCNHVVQSHGYTKALPFPQANLQTFTVSFLSTHHRLWKLVYSQWLLRVWHTLYTESSTKWIFANAIFCVTFLLSAKVSNGPIDLYEYHNAYVTDIGLIVLKQGHEKHMFVVITVWMGLTGPYLSTPLNLEPSKWPTVELLGL